MLDIKLKLKPGHTGERSWMTPSPLRTLFWNVTYACDYRCPICFTDAGPHRPDELTTPEARDLVRKASAAGVEDILISGGEPFMREDMVDLLALMAEFGLTARIASNGSQLQRSLLDRLKRETLVKSFQISLDTVDPQLYGRFHGTSPETLQTVLDGLRLIQERGFHTTVSVRLSPQTLPGISKLLDLAVRSGWSTLTIHCPVNINRSDGSFAQDDDVLSRLVPVFDQFSSLSEHWLIETYIPWAEYHPVMRRLGEKVRIVHRGCRAGRDRLTISPSGWVSPCVCLDVPAAYLGNLRSSDLADLFSRSPICELMRRPREHGLCSDCLN
ncbi:MAG: radical SAM protein, partial [Acidobacteriota bacterium]